MHMIPDARALLIIERPAEPEMRETALALVLEKRRLLAAAENLHALPDPADGRDGINAARE